MLVGVGAEFFEQHDRLRGGRHLEIATLPECIEVVPRPALPRRLLARRLIQIAHPSHLVAQLGEQFTELKALGEIRKYIEVIAREAYRRDRLLHRDDEA